MQEMICPLEMIAVCGRDGRIRPIRFRYETSDQMLYTAHITEILSEKSIGYAGLEAILYLCRTKIGNFERVAELKYTVRTHRWSMARIGSWNS